MTFAAKGPAPGGRADPLECQLLAGVDLQTNSPIQPTAQVTNSRAVREAIIASILDESAYLLGGLMVHASIAQQYAEHGDVRGFLYSLGKTVEHAIRAGAEGVELRKVRKEMPEARR